MKGRISKKLLALLLSVAMVMTLTPMVAFGEGDEDTVQNNPPVEDTTDGNKIEGQSTEQANPSKSNEGEPNLLSQNETSDAVAKIGEEEFETLAKAINAVGEGSSEATVVTLLKNTSEQITIPANKNVVLNLGENTLTNSATNSYYAAVTVNGKLTVDATTGGVNGGIGSAFKFGNAGADLTINKGNYTVTGPAETIEMNNSGNLTINNGTFEGSKTKLGGMIVDVSSTGTNVTINNGNFSTVSELGSTSGNRASLIHVEALGSGQAKLIINNGTFTVDHGSGYRPQATFACVGVHNKNAYVEINGGKFTNAIAKETLTTTYLEQLSPALEVYSEATAKITGGEFTSNGWAAQLYAKEATIGVSNATFTSVDKNSYGLVLSSYTDGVYNISNCTCNGSIALFGTGDSDATADINITGGAFNGTTYGMYFGEGSDITIDNATVTAGSSNYAIRNYAGNLTINGGTFTGACGLRDEHSATINGGTFDGSSYGIQVYTGGNTTINNATVTGTNYGLYNYDGQLTVKGGTFNGGRALYDMNNSTVEGGTFNGTGESGNAVYSSGYATTNITGGTFDNEGKNTIYVGCLTNSDTGAVTRRGVLNVSNKPIINGGTSSTQSVGIFNYGGTVTVEGGLFKSKTDATSNFTTYNHSDGGGTLTVSGGFYNIQPTKSTAVTLGEGLAVINTPEGEERSEGYIYTVGQSAPKVAQIGEKKYESLAAAIGEVQNGQTIEMLCDVNGAHGISVPSDKNFTVDFDGNSYSVEKPGAGSSGTKTQAFQLLKNSNITFKNGTISCTEANKDCLWASSDAEKGVAMIIQNYANLTLDNMTIDATNIAHNGNNVRYAVSNNCGVVNIKNESKIITTGNDFAFDSCKYANYDKPTVNVENSIITGKVEASGGNINLRNGAVVNGQVRVGENKSDGAVGSVLNIKPGATVSNEGNYAVVGFRANTINIEGTVNGIVGTNGNKYNGGVKINVKEGANITNNDDVAIYMPNGALNISGGTITGATAVYFKSTSLNITGGELIAKGNKADYVYDGNGCNATGDALVIDSCNYPNGIEDVSISGGNFKSEKGNAIAAFTSQGGNAVTHFLSGGHFSNQPFDTYIVEGKQAVDDTEAMKEAGYNYTLGDVVTKTEYSIEASSGMKNNTSVTVCNIIGGGTYEKGSEVTLKASAVDNFNFLGWFIKTDSGYEEEAKSTELTYTFTAENNVKIIAIYEPLNETLNLTAKVVTRQSESSEIAPATGSIKMGEVTSSDPQSTEASVGSNVLVKAIPGEGGHSYFICWQNEAGSILSTSPEYEVPLLQSKTIEAVFANEGAALVNYQDDNNNSLSSKLYFASEAGKAVEAVAPTRKGQAFDHWSDADGNKMEQYEVQAAIEEKSSEGNVGVLTLVANYAAPTEYTVTVHFVREDGSPLGAAQQDLKYTNSIGKSSKITVNEKTDDNQLTFQGYRTEKKGEIVSDTLSITVNPVDDVELWAVYGLSKVTRTACLTLDQPYNASTNANKIGYTMSWNLPEGCTLVEAGFVYGLSTEKTFIEKTILTSPSGTMLLNININGKENQTVYLRAYVTYTDGTNTYTLRSGKTGTVKQSETNEVFLNTVFENEFKSNKVEE